MLSFHSDEAGEIYEFFLNAYKRSAKSLPSGKFSMVIDSSLI